MSWTGKFFLLVVTSLILINHSVALADDSGLSDADAAALQTLSPKDQALIEPIVKNAQLRRGNPAAAYELASLLIKAAQNRQNTPSTDPNHAIHLRWAIESALDSKLGPDRQKTARSFAVNLMQMPSADKKPNPRAYPRPLYVSVRYRKDGELKQEACSVVPIGRQELSRGGCRYQVTIPKKCLAKRRDDGKWFNPSALAFFEFGVVKKFDIYYENPPTQEDPESPPSKEIAVVSFATACLPADQLEKFDIAKDKPRLATGQKCPMPAADQSDNAPWILRANKTEGDNLYFSTEKAVIEKHVGVINGNAAIAKRIFDETTATGDAAAVLKKHHDQFVAANWNPIDHGAPILTTTGGKRQVVGINTCTDLTEKTICTGWRCMDFARGIVEDIEANQARKPDNKANPSLYQGPAITDEEEAELGTQLSLQKYTTLFDRLTKK